MHDVPCVLELRGEFDKNARVQYSLGMDLKSVMTKFGVESYLALLYRISCDNCHYHDKIAVLKSLYKHIASSEQHVVESLFLRDVISKSASGTFNQERKNVFVSNDLYED